MDEEPLTTRIEWTLDCMVRDLDEIGVVARSEDRLAVENNKAALGQVLTRVQLILSVLQP